MRPVGCSEAATAGRASAVYAPQPSPAPLPSSGPPLCARTPRPPAERQNARHGPHRCCEAQHGIRVDDGMARRVPIPGQLAPQGIYRIPWALSLPCISKSCSSLSRSGMHQENQSCMEQPMPASQRQPAIHMSRTHRHLPCLLPLVSPMCPREIDWHTALQSIPSTPPRHPSSARNHFALPPAHTKHLINTMGDTVPPPYLQAPAPPAA